MPDVLPWGFDDRTDHFYIHFDVEDHFLSLDTFIQTAESARKVVEALDKTFFQGDLAFEIIVMPPEEGSFLTRLGVFLTGAGVLLGGAGALLDQAINLTESDVGAAYIEGLTGKSPAEWAEDLGKDHRAALESLEKPETRETKSKTEGDSQTSPQERLSDRDARTCQRVTRLVTSMTRGILEGEPEALKKIGMEAGNLPDAMDARADFYEACIKNPEVKQIGFSPEDDFPIPRSSFPARAQRPERKEKEEEEPEWIVAKESIYVNSPNWSQDKQNTRMWQGKDSIRRECLFVVEDAEFWGRIRRKELHFEGLDRLTVQWAYQLVRGKPKNRRVLRVLEFNGAKLADPLPDDAIAAILGAYKSAEASRGGATLFDI